jgi:hypothetical protein
MSEAPITGRRSSDGRSAIEQHLTTAITTLSIGLLSWLLWSVVELHNNQLRMEGDFGKKLTELSGTIKLVNLKLETVNNAIASATFDRYTAKQAKYDNDLIVGRISRLKEKVSINTDRIRDLEVKENAK